MTVLMIRSGKRYAVRADVTLVAEEGKRAGLIIELSAEGCRISNLGDTRYAIGEEVVVTTRRGRKLPGRIRWSHDNVAGVRFDAALHLDDLTGMVAACRGVSQEPQPRYGT